MKAVVVIPARLGSTRLPDKVLLEAGGKPLIRHVYERARGAKLAARIVVATDDARVRSAVEAFGGEARMTDTAHTSGSARVAEAARGLDADIVVNVQGDEPEIDPEHIDALIRVQRDHAPFAATLAAPFPPSSRPEDANAVKAVLGRRIAEGVHDALYFTRALAPWPRDAQGAADPAGFHLHVGVYAYSAASLQRFAKEPEGRLERIERLEQLRILEMGERIAVGLVSGAARGVDTAEDFAAFRRRVETR